LVDTEESYDLADTIEIMGPILSGYYITNLAFNHAFFSSIQCIWD